MDTMEERWLPVKDFEGLYEVSDLGRVKGLKRGKILAGGVNKDGYIHVILSKKPRKDVLVHRLVLQAFLPTGEKLEVDHENHIKTDNRLVNLRWATSSQNTRFQKKREGTVSCFKGVCKSKNKWMSQCRLDGKKKYLGTFDTEEEAARAYDKFVIENDLQEFTFLNFNLKAS